MITELASLYQDMVHFISVRADCIGLDKVARQLKIVKFPTILIFRGGLELERLEGDDRLGECLVSKLSKYVKESDKMSHSKHKHRLKIEKAALLGKEPPKEEVEEKNNVDWTWDPEGCGSSIKIDQNGMRAYIFDDDENDVEPIKVSSSTYRILCVVIF